MARRMTVAAFLAALFVATPALAQSGGEGAPPVPPPVIAFRPVVDAIVDKVILPGYAALDDAAARQAEAVSRLCARPDAASLAAARGAFASLVAAWSKVEMFRFGPAREDNRFERLFFWPDQKGLGNRQVEEILRSEDATATDVVTLRQKSVAVQGLLALELVLHGDGSESLAAGTPDTFRCRYGRTVAEAIAQTARELDAGWTAEKGYGFLMRNAGPDDPVYRSHGEVVQDLIRAAREQLQIDRDLKLARAIGDKPKAANPRRSPFWRSDQTLAAIAANLDAVIEMQAQGGFADVLPEPSKWYANSLAFELRQARDALRAVDAKDGTWEAGVRDPAGHARLGYALIPLGSAIDLLSSGYPEALGLTAGFNSQDGD